MLHPTHLNPVSQIDPNKLAWLAWWKEERYERVSQQNTDVVFCVISALAFALAWADDAVGGSKYILGCLCLVAAAVFYYRRRTGKNIVDEWDEIGQLPYVEQCRVVHDQLVARGKPGWFHVGYLIVAPVVWVVWNTGHLNGTWTEAMTRSLITGFIFGIVLNFFIQGRMRIRWQQGVDLAQAGLAV